MMMMRMNFQGQKILKNFYLLQKKNLYQQELSYRIENVRGKGSEFKAKVSSLISRAEDVKTLPKRKMNITMKLRFLRSGETRKTFD